MKIDSGLRNKNDRTIDKNDYTICGPFDTEDAWVYGNHPYVLYNHLEIVDSLTKNQFQRLKKLNYLNDNGVGISDGGYYVHEYTFTDSGWDYIKIKYIL
jgi:hypothetical protein